MRPFAFALPLLLSTSLSFSAECIESPIKRVFYQPYIIDLELSRTQWRQRVIQLSNIGITDLYLQWTAYGDENFLTQRTSDGIPFLLTLAQITADSNIGLHFGLVSDPEWFELSQQSGISLQQYLAGIRTRSLAQAMEIYRQFARVNLAGWYLPEEIYDSTWENRQTRNQLKLHLQTQVNALDEMTDNLPVAISGYTGGNMPPEEYARLWQELLAIEGLEFWHQDGNGTAILETQVRHEYPSALQQTIQPGRWGIIAELFQQVSAPNEEFAAQPANMTLIAGQLQDYASLQDTLPLNAFSLRYLFNDNAQLLQDYQAMLCVSAPEAGLQ